MWPMSLLLFSWSRPNAWLWTGVHKYSTVYVCVSLIGFTMKLYQHWFYHETKLEKCCVMFRAFTLYLHVACSSLGMLLGVQLTLVCNNYDISKIPRQNLKIFSRTTGPISTNLAQSILGEGNSNLSNELPCPSPSRDNHKILKVSEEIY